MEESDDCEEMHAMEGTGSHGARTHAMKGEEHGPRVIHETGATGRYR